MARTKKDFYFIGFGNMAQAIYQRMNKTPYENIFLIEKSNQRIKEIKKLNLNSQTNIKNKLGKKKLGHLDTILLAVKPAQIKSVCTQLKTLLNSSANEESAPLIISIAAGVPCRNINGYIGAYPIGFLVRAMPNLCAKKGASITGLFRFGLNNNDVWGKEVSKIFTSIGKVLWVDKESDLDSVTAISGSGPAYIYYIMNAMIDAAEELGLEKSVAQKLVAQTIIGAGETGKNIDNLESEIIKVSSKGGTTEKAISIFKQKKLDTIIKQAIKAAHKRSKELSK
jgi:pyrroline-5-carboxylate reductase